MRNSWIRAVGVALCAVLVSGCALFAERPRGRFTLTNNSDQAITLRLPRVYRGEVVYGFTTVAKARSIVKVPQAFASGDCFDDWQIVDAAGVVLRWVDRVCDGDTVVYP